jgi:hypothetical protein
MRGKPMTFALDMVDNGLFAYVLTTALMFVLSLPYVVYKEIERRSTAASAAKDHEE